VIGNIWKEKNELVKTGTGANDENYYFMLINSINYANSTKVNKIK
jgi:hypothetical protein